MKRTAIVGIHSWVLWSLIVSSAFNLNQHLELNGSRSRRCRQTVKVETDDRHKYVDAYDTTGDGGGMYTHHRTSVGIYKRNLEQANSNHFVLATVFLSFDERMYMRGRRRGGFCTPFAGDGSVEGCISGWKRAGKRKRANYDEGTLWCKMSVK